MLGGRVGGRGGGGAKDTLHSRAIVPERRLHEFWRRARRCPPPTSGEHLPTAPMFGQDWSEVSAPKFGHSRPTSAKVSRICREVGQW